MEERLGGLGAHRSVRVVVVAVVGAQRVGVSGGDLVVIAGRGLGARRPRAAGGATSGGSEARLEWADAGLGSGSTPPPRRAGVRACGRAVQACACVEVRESEGGSEGKSAAGTGDEGSREGRARAGAARSSLPCLAGRCCDALRRGAFALRRRLGQWEAPVPDRASVAAAFRARLATHGQPSMPKPKPIPHTARRPPPAASCETPWSNACRAARRTATASHPKTAPAPAPHSCSCSCSCLHCPLCSITTPPPFPIPFPTNNGHQAFSRSRRGLSVLCECLAHTYVASMQHASRRGNRHG